MDYIYLGTITSTHGIKGEVKIKSNFDKKDLVFKKDFTLYIGDDFKKEVINTYRVHKGFDMVSFKGINDINDVLKYIGLKVYLKRVDLNLANNDYLLQDLIDCKIICDNNYYGKVIDIYDNKGNILLYIKHDKFYYIPYVDEFIKKVDIKNKEIVVVRIGELYAI